MQNKKSKRVTRKEDRSRNLWPLLIAIGGVLLVVVAFLVLRRGDPSPKTVVEVQGAPSLKVDKEELDLGNVRLGEWVSASFQLTNVGDKPLKFTGEPYIEVKEGC